MCVLKNAFLGWEQDEAESAGCIQPRAPDPSQERLFHLLGDMVCNGTGTFNGTNNSEMSVFSCRHDWGPVCSAGEPSTNPAACQEVHTPPDL